MLRVIENYATLSELTKALANRCAQTVPRRSPDGPQTVPRRSPAEKHTVPDHFKIHKGRFPNPFLIILKWSGTVCFFAGDRLGTVWGPSGDRLGTVAGWSFVTSTQETLLCELKPSPSLHYSPHLDSRKFHLPIT